MIINDKFVEVTEEDTVIPKDIVKINEVTKTFKKDKVKKKAQTIMVVTVKNAEGTVTYIGEGTNQKSQKYLKFNKKECKITVKKGTTKGAY